LSADIGEQEIKLFVKSRTGFVVDPAELSSWLAKRLAPYQNPRYICVIDEFKRTASHRIIKQTLPATPNVCWDREAVNQSL
jgi:crotonobetaine/carnitine-CoA ligase